jgi:hypothetical protein
MAASNIIMLVAGLAVCALGFWLFKRLGKMSDEGRQWMKSELMKNMLVFGMLGTWCVGIVLIGYGLGLGAKM